VLPRVLHLRLGRIIWVESFNGKNDNLSTHRLRKRQPMYDAFMRQFRAIGWNQDLSIHGGLLISFILAKFTQSLHQKQPSVRRQTI
jgi:hypothetical protein